MKTTDGSALEGLHEVLKKHSLSEDDCELSEQDLTDCDSNQKMLFQFN